MNGGQVYMVVRISGGPLYIMDQGERWASIQSGS